MMMNGEMSSVEVLMTLDNLRVKNLMTEKSPEVDEALRMAYLALIGSNRIVKCKDCKHRDRKDDFCHIMHRIVDDCDFCSRSERADSLADCGHCKHGQFVDTDETCGYCDHHKRWTDRFSGCPDWRERHGL